jgi:hypothetical protein
MNKEESLGDATLLIVRAVIVAALEGATEIIPKPRDATATSATRLKVVFVDICFLSISQKQEFPALGLGKSAFPYVMRGHSRGVLERVFTCFSGF